MVVLLAVLDGDFILQSIVSLFEVHSLWTTSIFRGDSLSLQYKDRVAYPLPCLSVQMNFSFSLVKQKLAHKDSCFYPLPPSIVTLYCNDREFPRNFDVVPKVDL